MAIRASSGHAATAPDPLLQQAYQWLHLVAAGLWIGGLVLLLVLLRERLGTGRPPVQEARRFSNLAVWSVGVVAVTGVLRALSELGGMTNLLDGLRASYGLTLIAKVAAGLALIGLGATNRLRNVAILAEDERPLRRFVGAETVAALGVLVLTGVLTGLNPPVAAATGPATGADFATTTRVSLFFTPGFAGPNAFRAEVTRYDTGSSSSSYPTAVNRYAPRSSASARGTRPRRPRSMPAPTSWTSLRPLGMAGATSRVGRSRSRPHRPDEHLSARRHEHRVRVDRGPDHAIAVVADRPVGGDREERMELEVIVRGADRVAGVADVPDHITRLHGTVRQR
jgi:uncharacterized membrane protein